MTTQLLKPGVLDEGLRSGLFLYGLRRTGKTTFLLNDLIPALEEAAALVIYVDLWSNSSTALMGKVAVKIREPLVVFLRKHSHPRDRLMFVTQVNRLRGDDDTAKKATDQDLLIVIPAFVLSELTEAFQIGFLIFLPFLALDMTVSNILMALGMQMLNPTTISLPFKLLLFVLVDGWYLLTKGLVLGYQ